MNSRRILKSIRNAGYFSFVEATDLRRIRRCAADPRGTQMRTLISLLERLAGTAFGRSRNLAAIRTYEEFAEKIPIADY